MSMQDIIAELRNLRDSLDGLNLEDIQTDVSDSTSKKGMIEKLARQYGEKVDDILKRADEGISIEDTIKYLDTMINDFRISDLDTSEQERVINEDARVDKSKRLDPKQAGTMVVVKEIKRNIYDKLTRRRDILKSIAHHDPEGFLEKKQDEIKEKKEKAEKSIEKIKELERAESENKRKINKLNKLKEEIDEFENNINKLWNDIVSKGWNGTLSDTERDDLINELDDIDNDLISFPTDEEKNSRRNAIVTKLNSDTFLSDESNAKAYAKAKKDYDKLWEKKRKKENECFGIAREVTTSIKNGSYSDSFKRDYTNEVYTTDRSGNNVPSPWKIIDFFGERGQKETYRTDFENALEEIEETYEKIEMVKFAYDEAMKKQETQSKGKQGIPSKEKQGTAKGKTTTATQKVSGHETQEDLIKTLKFNAMSRSQVREAAYRKALADKGAKYSAKILHPILALRAQFGNELVEDFRKSFVTGKSITLDASQKDDARKAYGRADEEFKKTIWVEIKSQKVGNIEITDGMMSRAKNAADTELENSL